MFSMPSLTPVIPKSDHSVTSATDQLICVGWIPCDPINTHSMSLEFGAIAYLRLFRIPHPNHFISQPAGYPVTQDVPRDGTDRGMGMVAGSMFPVLPSFQTSEELGS